MDVVFSVLLLMLAAGVTLLVFAMLFLVLQAIGAS